MTSYIYAKLYSTWGDSNLEYIFTLQSSATKRLYMLINNCWSLYVVLINYFKLCCYYKLFHYTMQMHTLINPYPNPSHNSNPNPNTIPNDIPNANPND